MSGMYAMSIPMRATVETNTPGGRFSRQACGNNLRIYLLHRLAPCLFLSFLPSAPSLGRHVFLLPGGGCTTQLCTVSMLRSWRAEGCYDVLTLVQVLLGYHQEQGVRCDGVLACKYNGRVATEPVRSNYAAGTPRGAEHDP